MKDIKLIALDMDGTLLTSGDEISPYTEKVIKQALDQDIEVVLSTGRSIDTSYPFGQALNLSTYIITCNGGQIWTMQKEIVEEHLMEAKQIEKMWYLAKEQEATTWMISTDEIYRDYRPDDFYIHKWLKFGCYINDQKKLDYIVRELSHMENVELTNSLPTNVEVNPQGVHKANGLRRVCRELGLKMENVMSVGDSLNDIKMIQEAGIGVAMGNAQDAVKKAADAITETNDEDGVALAIERYALGNEAL
ncbi:MAG TPA: Cof-type HAD-IIB family hydrolase [Bacillota bacterium]|nr:Cof-type HAD-IIB family hydrolase [Bacillota bacterium]